eukprot:scaffold269132_cov17-Tisochrysis_lutea.AAC.1
MQSVAVASFVECKWPPQLCIGLYKMLINLKMMIRWADLGDAPECLGAQMLCSRNDLIPEGLRSHKMVWWGAMPT